MAEEHSGEDFQTGVARGVNHWLRGTSHGGMTGGGLAAFERGVVQGVDTFLSSAGLDGQPGAKARQAVVQGVSEGFQKWLDDHKTEVLTAIAASAAGRQ